MIMQASGWVRSTHGICEEFVAANVCKRVSRPPACARALTGANACMYRSVLEKAREAGVPLAVLCDLLYCSNKEGFFCPFSTLFNLCVAPRLS